MNVQLMLDDNRPDPELIALALCLLKCQAKYLSEKSGYKGVEGIRMGEGNNLTDR